MFTANFSGFNPSNVACNIASGLIDMLALLICSVFLSIIIYSLYRRNHNQILGTNNT
ncbi:hypothetical protein I4U23_004173 [Adineta vaga]|nr:hypothetical protein I4U23_004173 [Adineta vaga]